MPFAGPDNSIVISYAEPFAEAFVLNDYGKPAASQPAAAVNTAPWVSASMVYAAAFAVVIAGTPLFTLGCVVVVDVVANDVDFPPRRPSKRAAAARRAAFSPIVVSRAAPRPFRA